MEESLILVDDDDDGSPISGNRKRHSEMMSFELPRDTFSPSSDLWKTPTISTIDIETDTLTFESRMRSSERSFKLARVEYEHDLREQRHLVEKERHNRLLVQETLERAELRIEQLLHDMNSLTEDNDAQVEHLKAQMRSLAAESSRLSKELFDGKEARSHDQLKHQAEMKEKCRQIEDQQQEVEAQKAENQTLKSKVEQMEEVSRKYQETLNENNTLQTKLMSLEVQLAKLKDYELLSASYKSQIQRLAEMERENRQLSSDNKYLKGMQENILLAEEKLRSCQMKLAQTEKRNAEMQDRVESLEEELKQVMEKRDAEAKAAEGLSAELQACREKEEQYSLTLQDLSQSIVSLKSLSQKLEAELGDVGKGKSQCDAALKRYKKRVILLTKERDAYQSVLQSYESESSFSAMHVSATRVRQLEELLNDYREQLRTLEDELQQAVGGKSENQTIVELKARIVALEEHLTTSEREKEGLHEQLERLSAAGDFDPTSTRVLHLQMNPFQMAVDERLKQFDRLREENQRLQSRIQLLESKGDVANLTQQVDENVNDRRELENLKKKLESSEKMYLRLKEAVKKVTKELRQTVLDLTGYRVDLDENSVKVFNVYSSSEQFLIFKREKTVQGTCMTLLANDYAREFKHLTELYLEQCDSIPAFLSAITLELIQRQTHAS